MAVYILADTYGYWAIFDRETDERLAGGFRTAAQAIRSARANGCTVYGVWPDTEDGDDA